MHENDSSQEEVDLQEQFALANSALLNTASVAASFKEQLVSSNELCGVLKRRIRRLVREKQEWKSRCKLLQAENVALKQELGNIKNEGVFALKDGRALTPEGLVKLGFSQIPSGALARRAYGWGAIWQITVTQSPKKT